jgi:hypothetical protein
MSKKPVKSTRAKCWSGEASTPDDEPEFHPRGLCYRCEHRANFFETGSRPRCECGDVQTTKAGCYMYRPVRPVTLAPAKDDPRPQFGPAMLSSRSYVAKTQIPMRATLSTCGDESVIYWKPK